jgi:hypothetical protein
MKRLLAVLLAPLIVIALGTPAQAVSFKTDKGAFYNTGGGTTDRAQTDVGWNVQPDGQGVAIQSILSATEDVELSPVGYCGASEQPYSSIDFDYVKVLNSNGATIWERFPGMEGDCLWSAGIPGFNLGIRVNTNCATVKVASRPHMPNSPDPGTQITSVTVCD